VRRLKARRRRIDQRFDPVASLQATARYLTIAKRTLGRDDLAVASYHMGIGNVQSVLRAYGEGGDVAYPRLFFDTSPLHHAPAYRLLSSFGDDSSTYLWRVQAAREIMRAWRADPALLARTARLQTNKASAEEVLHPAASTPAFATPADVAHAEDDGTLTRLDPTALAKDGILVDAGMGTLAGRLGQPASRYAALRPAALDLLRYLGRASRTISGAAPLVLTSTVRDRRYQRLLVATNIEATRAYSLHTTGYAFDIERHYVSGAQAHAFQFLLDRLQASDLIAWVREPEAIHITVSSAAAEVLRR
jgi:hypothetical protein